MTAADLAQEFADRIAMTPFIWPLDEFIYAVVLETSCFDLSDAESLSAAASLTALLLGTGYIAIDWSGDDCSPLQQHVIDADEARATGANGAAEGWFDDAIQARRFLERRYRTDPPPPDSQAA